MLKTVGKHFVVAFIAVGLCFHIFTCLAISLPSAPSVWAAQDVEEAIQLGYVPVNLQNKYQDGITRGEFAKVSLYFLVAQYNYYESSGIDVSSFLERFLSSAAGIKVAAYSKEDIVEYLPIEQRESFDPDYDNTWNFLLHNITPFSDMASDYYVNAAYVLGIVNGRGDGSFAPEDIIVRQEAAAMLTRVYQIYCGKESLPALSDFSPITGFSDYEAIDGWARGYVSLMVDHQIMKGVEAGVFSPDTYYTREQCYSTFLRLYNNMPISRSKGNVERFASLEEDFSYIRGVFYEYSFKCYENDTIILMFAHYSGLPRGDSYSKFYIFWKNGGIKPVNGITPGVSDISDFILLYDEGEILSFVVNGCTYQLNMFSGELCLIE